MQSQPVRQALPLAQRRVRLLLLSALLVLGAALSTAALAASDTLEDCDGLDRELQALDVAAAGLPLGDAAYLDTAESRKLAVLASGDTPRDADSSATPVLLLTPRVANIMREVFSALPDDAADEDESPVSFDVLAADATESPVANNAEASADSTPASATPPVVKLPQPAFPESGEIDGSNNSRFIPRFQRQMYRTDI